MAKLKVISRVKKPELIRVALEMPKFCQDGQRAVLPLQRLVISGASIHMLPRKHNARLLYPTRQLPFYWSQYTGYFRRMCGRVARVSDNSFAE